MPRRRHSKICLPVARIAVAIGVALSVGACGGSTVAAVKTAGRYTDPTGWLLRYPAGTSVEHSSRNGMGALSEITFSSFPQASAKSGENINLGPPRSPAGVFPATGVAFRITDFQAAVIVTGGADSAFPVQLADFKPASPGSAHTYGALELNDVFIADGQRLSASAFVGRRASKQAIANLREMIASLAFRPERRGTVAAHFDYDLGSPARFPTGSFTAVHDPLVGLVYVIHAPGRPADGITASCLQGACAPSGSYYGIAPNTILVHSGSHCRLLLDRRADEFYCPGTTARWNRLGYPIGANPHPPLAVVSAKTSWDGQLVLEGDEGSPPRTQIAARRAARVLWPAWAHAGT